MFEPDVRHHEIGPAAADGPERAHLAIDMVETRVTKAAQMAFQNDGGARFVFDHQNMPGRRSG
jgi:hypothetical protein